MPTTVDVTPASASLSVVVPTLEEELRMPRLLRSLAESGAPAHDAPPLEVIVVDGGSRDRTREIARAAGARILTTPAGRGRQLAAGGRAARGDLLLFLHADTHLAPDALGALREVLAEPGVIACGLSQRIDHGARIFRWIERAADARVRRGRAYGDSGLCVRREAYEAVGGYRDLPLFEDLDLSLRLRSCGRVVLAERARIHVSARRWERSGPLRRTLLNWGLRLAWTAGVPSERLVRYYPAYGSERDAP